MQVAKLLITALLAVAGTHAMAQVQQSRGQYSLNYKELLGTFDKKEVPPKAKQKALEEATLKAVEAYYAEAGQSESANFDAIRSKIIENQSRYVLESTIIAEDDNKKDFRYTVVVRASLNVANLRNVVQANSAVGRATEAEKSALALIFVSRQVASEKSFDDRVYKRSEASVQLQTNATRQESSSLKEKTSEGESLKKGRLDTNGSRSQQQRDSVETDLSEKVTATTETGGSTTRKASESSWKVFPSGNLKQTFAAAFAQAGYDVVEDADVESGSFKIASLKKDYESGDDLTPESVRAIAAAMRAANVPYVALCTLDLGLAAKDPQTGLMRVNAIVNARVLDVTKPRLRTKVAIEPFSYSGVGPDESQARESALKLAARSAAQELSSRMATLGVR